MRHLILALALLVLALPAFGQSSWPSTKVEMDSGNTLQEDVDSGAIGGGGSSAFDDITSGTNTTADMVVGNGATIELEEGGEVEANEVVIFAQNETGATIEKCTAVHIHDFDIPSALPEVVVADADDGTLMPALGIAYEQITDGNDGRVMLSGMLSGADTDGSAGSESWAEGDRIYVKDSVGAITDDCSENMTNVRPANVDDAVQAIGTVVRAHTTLGKFVVSGAGRANDVPNLQDGYMWVGNSSNVATAVAAVGTGDVVGPGSSTDNAIPTWDGTGGDTLQDSLCEISDTGVLDCPLVQPDSGVDSVVTLIENTDASGSNTASIVIDADEDLPVNEAMYATKAGLAAPYSVWCFAYRNGQVQNDRRPCQLGESNGTTALANNQTNVDTLGFPHHAPPGYDLKILAMEVITGSNAGAGNVADCDVHVETNEAGTSDYDNTAPYDTDDFVSRGSIEVGPNSSNTGGWGVDVDGGGSDTEAILNGRSDGYGKRIDYTIDVGYFIVTFRDRVPGSEDCNWIMNDWVYVYVQRVPE